MNATAQSADLLQELDFLLKVTAVKPTIPVLANCLAQAEGEGLRLAATDLEVGLITFCPASITLPGITTLPVKHLLEITKLLQGDVSLVLEQHSVRLSSGNYKSRLQTFSPSDYPAMPSMKDLPTITVSGLQQAIRKVRYAVTDKQKRFFMDGALLSFTNSQFTLAATDGHRLAYASSPAQSCEIPPFIIPSKTLDVFLSMPDGDTLIAVGPKHLFFVIDGRLLFSRMIDGTFPNYQRIIPRENDRSAVFLRSGLQASLKRLVLTSTEVSFYFSSHTLTLKVKSAEIGEAVEHMPIVYDGPDDVIALNASYLLDFLNEADGTDLNLSWKKDGPLLFTDMNYQYVQLPFRSV